MQRKDHFALTIRPGVAEEPVHQSNKLAWKEFVNMKWIRRVPAVDFAIGDRTDEKPACAEQPLALLEEFGGVSKVLDDFERYDYVCPSSRRQVRAASHTAKRHSP